MPRGHRRFSLSFLFLPLLVATLAAGDLAAEPPERTSSFHGEVTGEGIAAGDTVSAWVNGVPRVSSGVVDEPGVGWIFRLDVPIDDPTTPETEGAVDGQTVDFRLDALPLGAERTIQNSTYLRSDLDAPVGVDLAVVVDDGRDAVVPGENVSWTIEATNLDPARDATGVALRVALPPGASFVSASDGGAVSGAGADEITWPTFALAAGQSTSRTIELRVDDRIPADLDAVRVEATVESDGADGLDPVPTNDVAVDLDRLAAFPDVSVTIDDGLESVSPGAFVDHVVRVENLGTRAARGVALTVELPADVLFQTADADGGETSAGLVTWPEFLLDAGASTTRTFRVLVPTSTTSPVLAHEASAVIGNGPDSDGANDTAVDLTTVELAADLVAASLDASALVVDAQTLEIVSGSVVVEVRNDGAVALDQAVSVALFDARGEASPLATATLPGGLAPGASALVEIAPQGSIRFRDDLLHALVDSGDVVAELDETNNLVSTSFDCTAPPIVRQFDPVVEMAWPRDDSRLEDPQAEESMSTPIVVQLTDDNGDGRMDENDVPEIVFVTYDPVLGSESWRLRAINGATGDSLFAVLPEISSGMVFALSGLAAGDLDGDGDTEIVVTTPEPPLPPFFGFGTRLSIYDHRGRYLYSTGYFETHPTGGFTNRDQPALADLDGDGDSEIIVGAHVFRHTGQRLWRGTGGQAYQSARNANEADSGAISIVADLDLDGSPEVVTGNTAYRGMTGEIVWQVAYADGYPAVANFDDDDEPEIVVVARGFVRLHEHDGTLIWGPVNLPGVDPEAGGAPTVADFDGDGEVEIGVAGSDFYVVFETDGTVKWQRSIEDESSNQTGSTVFDFDGDGRFEVVYRDERHLRIYAGDTGEVLFQDAFSSFTANEEPVVADVDGDGRAEIVVTSDLALELSGSFVRTAGLRVYGDANGTWVPARRVWNQHAYAITNVGEDGSIPRRETPSWLEHNTFRANVAPGGVALAAPDLTASRITVETLAYPTARVGVRVGNGGARPAPAGVPVALYAGSPEDGGLLLGVATTSRILAPADFENLQVLVDLPLGLAEIEMVAVLGDDGTAAPPVLRDCREENNRHAHVHTTEALGLWLRLEDGTERVHAGRPVTYTLTVGNGSLATRSGVVLEDTLPVHAVDIVASDAGAFDPATRVVTWPTFSLVGGEITTRTLTFTVDPNLPLDVTQVLNQASVQDDGSVFEPSPWDLQRNDLNQVRTALALPGGPYVGVEGSAIAFDGSTSSDRDGTIVAWEWDFDGDGVFETSGATASSTFVESGSYEVALRVTDDSGETDIGTTTVDVTNAAPVPLAGAPATSVEGQAVTIRATFTDAGALDTHTATVDWGEGAEVATVSADGVGGGTVASGSVEATRTFSDDADATARVCVTDDEGAVGCVDAAYTVENAAPIVLAENQVDLRSWSAESLPTAADPADWRVSTDGTSVTQRANSRPTVFVGPLALVPRIEGEIRVDPATTDDDFIGFVLGYRPGDFADPEADWLLLSWKQRTQGESPAGLALGRVRGIPSNTEINRLVDLPENGSSNGVEELARGAISGSTGWIEGVDHRFTFEIAPERLRIFVDGALEIDLGGDFSFLGGGRFGFYNASQDRVRYRGFTGTGVASLEGESVAIDLPFDDLGRDDTHAASVAWGDGTTSDAEIVPISGTDGLGRVLGEHAWLQDGHYAAEVCVTDDDAGEGCGTVDANVFNAPPVLDTGRDRPAYPGVPLEMVASFTDPGVLDTHVATVTWSDGTGDPEPATVVQGAGSGSIETSRVFDSTGDVDVELCVDDGDGGVDCDDLRVFVRDPVFDVGIELLADRFAARVGETVRFAVHVVNRGSLEPTGVTASLDLPVGLDFVAADRGGILDGRRVTWTLPRLEFRGREIFTVETIVPAVPIHGQEVTATAAWSDDGALGDDVTPSDDVDTASVRLYDENTPIVEVGFDLGRDDQTQILPSSESSFQPASQAFDGDLETIWRLEAGDAVNRGGEPYLDLVLPRDAAIWGVAFFENRSTTGGQILAGRFDLFDEFDRLLHSTGEVALGADRIVDLPNTPGVRRVRFTPTADTTERPALAELRLVGVYGDAAAARVGEGVRLAQTTLVSDDDAGAFTGVVDWGDGTSDAAEAFALGSLALLDAEHAYGDDGEFLVEACATDPGGTTGCASLAVLVANASPVVDDGDTVDLRSWSFDQYVGDAVADWVVSADGTEVEQRNNAGTSYFFGDRPVLGRRHEVTIRVENTTDDDYIGIALGYRPGATADPTADFLLVEWKKEDQPTTAAEGDCGPTGIAVRGLRVERLRGVPTSSERSLSIDDPCNGGENGVDLLARGANLGDRGWTPFTDHHFVIEVDPGRLRVEVDGRLEIDLEGDFSFLDGGFLGFYNFSQISARYRLLPSRDFVTDEGRPVELAARFLDTGFADQHTATVDWGDGTAVESATVIESAGAGGRVEASHVYADEPVGTAYSAEICVTDDDGATGCGSFPVRVRNVAPTLDLAPEATAATGGAYLLEAAYFDPGTGDTHAATVDWGDGSPVENVPATATGPGVGTISASHAYDAIDTFEIVVCVVDDDGGEDCASQNLGVAGARPPADLGVSVEPGFEGRRVALAASFLDPDAGDAHTATIDWGDGSLVEDVAVQPNAEPLGGALVASHVYAENGTYPARVCVTDSSEATLCADAPVSIENLPPRLGPIDFTTWTLEAFDPPVSSSSADPDWRFFADGSQVTQWSNADASVVYSDFPVHGQRLIGRVRVNHADENDYLGFAIGFEPGDTTNPDADYLLVTWKGRAEGNNPVGLRIYRVRGVPADFWRLDLDPAATLLATGATLGGQTWQRNNDYRFDIESTAERVRLRVDGRLEIDLVADPSDPFPNGRLGLYTHANQRTYFREWYAAPASDPAAGDLAEGTALSPFVTEIDFRTWTNESLFEPGTATDARWDVYDAGVRVEQRRNSGPSVFYDDRDLHYGRVSGMMQFLGDDDVGGLVFGFTPGQSRTADAHYVMIEWAGSGEPGVRAYRVRGPIGNFRVDHERLAEGRDTAWTAGPPRFWTAEYAPDRLRFWIDGEIELDIVLDLAAGDAPFPDGRFGLFSHFQEGLRFFQFERWGTSIDEGELSPPIALGYADPGVLDTHSATIQWGDGSPYEAITGEVGEVANGGVVLAPRVFADDVLFDSEVCVTDDDGATACGHVPLRVLNVAPTAALDAAASILEVSVGSPAVLAVTFTDPGTGDTHAATIDWGDGSPVETVAAVAEDTGTSPGTGVVTATHVYAAGGEHPVVACVVDDDGGADCVETLARVDDVVPVTLTIEDATVDESAAGDVGTAPARFALVLDQPANRDLVVAWQTTFQGTATAGVDYTATAGLATVVAGEIVAHFDVPVLGDRVDELDESFGVEITVDDEAAEVIRAEAIATILDDDETRVSVRDASIEEGAAGTSTVLRFPVELSHPADRDLVVEWSSVERTASATQATADIDYVSTVGSFVVPAHESTSSVEVEIVGDDVFEMDESFDLVLLAAGLADGTSIALERPEAEGTILDDELCVGPELLANPGAEVAPFASEPPSWTIVAGDWTPRLADPEPAEGFAAFATLPGSPFAELRQDIDLAAFTEAIDQGALTLSVGAWLRLADEATPDAARLVVESRDAAGGLLDAWDSGAPATLGAWVEVAGAVDVPPGARVLSVRLVVEALDESGADAFFDAITVRSTSVPVLTAIGASVYESEATPAVFDLRLACALDRPIEIVASTADGTATAVEDYAPVAELVTFETGETAHSVSVAIVADGVEEGTERFTLELAAPASGYGIVVLPASPEATIHDARDCARSPGYWKNHVEVWPTDWLVLGGAPWSFEEIFGFLEYGGPDAATKLARALVATRMNLLVGASPEAASIAEEADAFLAVHPPGSNPKGPAKGEANEIRKRLEAFYEGASCP